MTDVARIEELAALRDLVKRLPLAARRQLKLGPRKEPTCGICSALAAANGCASYMEELQDYHDVGIGTMADLADLELDELASALSGEDEELTEKVVRALAGALAAERCLTLYLLAGWAPPRVRRPAPALQRNEQT